MHLPLSLLPSLRPSSPHPSLSRPVFPSRQPSTEKPATSPSSPRTFKVSSRLLKKGSPSKSQQAPSLAGVTSRTPRDGLSDRAILGGGGGATSSPISNDEDDGNAGSVGNIGVNDDLMRTKSIFKIMPVETHTIVPGRTSFRDLGIRKCTARISH